jgi:urease accessory protein
MCAVISRFEDRVVEPADPTAVHGFAELAFTRRNDVSRLAHLYQHDPVRVLFPNHPPAEPPQAVVVTTSGGLVGGDRLDLSCRIEPDAVALVTMQAAEKVYRSAGPDCVLSVALDVAAGGWLEWLPQETILFEGARLRRLTRASVAPGARMLAGEMLVFGRPARGERMTTGLVRDAWEVWRDGRLIWVDALHLDDDLGAVLANPVYFDGAVAAATAIHVAEDAGERLELARDLLGDAADGLRVAATLVNGVLVVRWLGRDALLLRQSFGAFWAGFRAAVTGLAPELPRLWHI